MKFTLIFATLAITQAVQVTSMKNGIDDESYDTHFDNLDNSMKNQYKAMDAARKAAVAKQESTDVWRGVKDTKIFSK